MTSGKFGNFSRFGSNVQSADTYTQTDTDERLTLAGVIVTINSSVMFMFVCKIKIK